VSIFSNAPKLPVINLDNTTILHNLFLRKQTRNRTVRNRAVCGVVIAPLHCHGGRCLRKTRGRRHSKSCSHPGRALRRPCVEDSESSFLTFIERRADSVMRFEIVAFAALLNVVIAMGSDRLKCGGWLVRGDSSDLTISSSACTIRPAYEIASWLAACRWSGDA
jgi:hypothetical protein